MANGLKVRVRIDEVIAREARETLGARSNSEAVELALAIALAVCRTNSANAAKYLKIICSSRFKI